MAARFGRAVAGGGLPAGAAEAARALVAQGVTALISFGLCGALDPALDPGALIVPRAVAAGGRAYTTDAALSVALGGWSAEMLLAGETAVAEPSAKAALFAATGAAAIDLESGAVAEVAHRAGLPFAVLRAVCDPARVGLPPAALAALDRRGAVSIGAVVASLFRQPRQIPELLGLARAAEAARVALVGRVDKILAGASAGDGGLVF